MDMTEYQHFASRTINASLSMDQMKNHALFEMCGELGEIHSIFQKEYQGHDIDIDNLKEEIGDLLWGIAELCTAFGMSLDCIAKENIAKLKKRYPDGFDPDRSVHRDDGKRTS